MVQGYHCYVAREYGRQCGRITDSGLYPAFIGCSDLPFRPRDDACFGRSGYRLSPPLFILLCFFQFSFADIQAMRLFSRSLLLALKLVEALCRCSSRPGWVSQFCMAFVSVSPNSSVFCMMAISYFSMIFYD
nr:hypothetical protein [Salmonella sp.]